MFLPCVSAVGHKADVQHALAGVSTLAMLGNVVSDGTRRPKNKRKIPRAARFKGGGGALRRVSFPDLGMSTLACRHQLGATTWR
jgi:hypothetical protein